MLSCAAEFMVVLDASVVNVALPAIKSGLGFGQADLQWVVNSYALVFAGFLLLGGRLADLYGRKRVFISGLVLFTAASAVGGMAGSPELLVAARAVQALGGALLVPASLTILTTTFPEGALRVRALAIWTALASAGGAAGSLLGGVLTEYLSWRWTLLINVPLGAVALVIAARVLAADHRLRGQPGDDSADEPGNGRRLDVLGAVSATLGLTALAFALSGAEDRGWGHPLTWGALLVAAAGLVVFVADELWLSKVPLIPLRLFRLRAVSLGNTAMLLAGACLMPVWYFLSLYMQEVLRFSAIMTGIGFLPHTLITVAVGAQLAPRLLAWFSPRVLIAAGSLVAAAGFWWQSLLEVDSTYLSGILGPAIAISVGVGLLNTPLTTAVTSGVTDDDAGAASGLMNTTKQVGGALGLAALVAVAAQAHTGDPSGQVNPAELSSGFSSVFVIMAGIMIVVAVLALTLPKPRD
ncbi:MFS transporter [Amycolatopsis keratiniphila subsp. keratiniphila]|uniref:MFS transporter n=2 Tax=Amycolatopsis keratiniphila TaxID=129921 RepID=A0A1W2M399_9PSEU|nr:MFS transporter [Amycolatopsis keratiniphila subsp. keratiniphila]